MKQWIQMNGESLLLALFMFVVGVIIVIVMTAPDDNYCSGMNYDYGKCLQQQVDSCMETDAFSRNECIQLAGEKSK